MKAAVRPRSASDRLQVGLGFAAQESGQWERLAPYLDRALDLPAMECERWLSEVASEHPDIAETLRQLLLEHEDIQRRGFLTDSSVDTPRRAWLKRGKAGSAAAKQGYMLAARHLVETLGDEHPDTVRAKRAVAGS